MEEKKLTELTDEELLQKEKKLKSKSILNALLVGVMIGIIIWSILKSTISLFTLIPLFFIYKLVNNSKKDNALKAEIKKRNNGAQEQ